VTHNGVFPTYENFNRYYANMSALLTAMTCMDDSIKDDNLKKK